MLWLSNSQRHRLNRIPMANVGLDARQPLLLLDLLLNSRQSLVTEAAAGLAVVISIAVELCGACSVAGIGAVAFALFRFSIALHALVAKRQRAANLVAAMWLLQALWVFTCNVLLGLPPTGLGCRLAASGVMLPLAFYLELLDQVSVRSAVLSC
jgi:hypothetical protein